MRFKSFGSTDVGRNRDHNEDHFLCNEVHRLFLVADGMGGHASGETASSLAIQSLEEFITKSKTKKIKYPLKIRKDLSPEQNRLLNAIVYSDRVLREHGEINPSTKGMGTTIVAAIIEDDHLAIANVGDSRIYQIRDGFIKQITIDHTLVEEQERIGIITKNQAKNHPYRHILTVALGHIDNISKIDISKTKIEKKDLYLICSDGLYNMLDNKEILTTIQSNMHSHKNGAVKKTCLSLLNKANLAGGLDNITAILISFFE
ncbi:MAG: serine/threonine-protein phosphatase [Deltaproteobacteria bacterium]|nr:serine/threonine-protein phosphatase [Deltaproteobacteria bacterium]